MSRDPIIPVILCGGTGTRLWPLSRESFPKQYLSLNSKNKDSLLQNTQKRISNLENIKDPILVCNEDHRFIVAEQMREINVKPLSILLEPVGRNTAPAICLAALKALEKYNNPTLIILSSDHIINNEDKFIEVIKLGLKGALQDKLVTFGIVPTKPEVGYGYIKSQIPFNNEIIEGSNIEEFIEKPDLDTAKYFLQDKRFTWNSGMFMFKASTILNELNAFVPELVLKCKRSIIESTLDLDFQRLENKIFRDCPNISIDKAVMEKTKNGIVFPLDVGWSDIGSWEAVWEMEKKDKNSNFIKGKTLIEDCRGCYLRSENRLIVGLGLINLIVIETNDAILIAEKSHSQSVKNIVGKLKVNNIPEGLRHKKIYRPWGNYISIVEDSRWQVKQIQVKQGEKLSLQMHHHRSEHWIVVKGTAQVEINDIKEVLSENQSIYIPLGAKHRLSNPGKIPLILIEVQSGSYVGEDDIVRFDDKYGRIGQ
tara:strand:+ start:3981 stop:5423 length:1443 start_codon:yes stop_codon:yes gene_type:complete